MNIYVLTKNSKHFVIVLLLYRVRLPDKCICHKLAHSGKSDTAVHECRVIIEIEQSEMSSFVGREQNVILNSIYSEASH